MTKPECSSKADKRWLLSLSQLSFWDHFSARLTNNSAFLQHNHPDHVNLAKIYQKVWSLRYKTPWAEPQWVVHTRRCRAAFTMERPSTARTPSGGRQDRRLEWCFQRLDQLLPLSTLERGGGGG